MEPRDTSNSNKSGDQFEQANGEEEAVRLAVSHERLAKGLQSRPGLELDCANEGKTASQSLTKHRTLKEITNKLDSRPAKLKPAWSGPRIGSGPTNREVGVVNQWVTYKVD